MSNPQGLTIIWQTLGIGPTAAAAEQALELALPELVARTRRVAEQAAAAAQMKLGIQAVQPEIADSTTMPPGATLSVSAIVRFGAP